MNIKKLPYRNHFSKKKFKLYYYENINKKNIFFKPDGLWYGINDSVIKWFELDPNDEEQIKYVNKKYIYEINLKKNSFSTNLNIKGKNKILQIKNFDQMNIFHEKYKNKEYGYILIDWDKVSKDYGGIEFTNYDKIKKKLYDLNFYKYSNDYMTYKYHWFFMDFSTEYIHFEDFDDDTILFGIKTDRLTNILLKPEVFINKLCNPIYKIIILKNNLPKKNKKILEIKNLNQLDNFHEKYKRNVYNSISINWEKVYEEYSEIQIFNYEKLKKKIYNLNKLNIGKDLDIFKNMKELKKSYIDSKYMWFYKLDFNSGCIWNLDILKDFKYKGEIKDFYPDK